MRDKTSIIIWGPPLSTSLPRNLRAEFHPNAKIQFLAEYQTRAQAIKFVSSNCTTGAQRTRDLDSLLRNRFEKCRWQRSLEQREPKKGRPSTRSPKEQPASPKGLAAAVCSFPTCSLRSHHTSTHHTPDQPAEEVSAEDPIPIPIPQSQLPPYPLPHSIPFHSKPSATPAATSKYYVRLCGKRVYLLLGTASPLLRYWKANSLRSDSVFRRIKTFSTGLTQPGDF